jgi:hypothetical protein
MSTKYISGSKYPSLRLDRARAVKSAMGLSRCVSAWRLLKAM